MSIFTYNDARTLTDVRLGAQGIETGTRGTPYFDDPSTGSGQASSRADSRTLALSDEAISKGRHIDRPVATRQPSDTIGDVSPPPTTEERVWAVLAHLSALALGMGLILPVIGWAEQRRKSKYVAFQCLQALGYQTLGYTVWILGYLVLLVILFIVMFLLISLAGDAGDNLIAFSVLGLNAFIFVSVFGSLGVYFLIPVIAAVFCAVGRDFRYPFMGGRLARFLEYEAENEDWMSETREDRWVAAMGHFSVIIALWGMLAPVTAWILQARRSAWLKFQSAQAIALHASVLLLGVVAGALYFFGFIVFIALTGFTGDSAMSSATGLIGLLVMFGSMVIALLILLLVPLFHIMGQWAGYRILKGDDYRYPVIGRLVERWISE